MWSASLFANVGQGEKWIEYINFETELDELQKVEVLFARSVPLAPYVALYSAYIDFIRRRYNLTTDSNGTNRQITTQAYEFVLDQVGIDVSAGKLWLDYIEMLKTGPGVLGGSSWQDMQKMDTIRKVYQRAVSIPHGATLEIWREYDRFEMNLNKVTVSCPFCTLYKSEADVFYRAARTSKRSHLRT